MEYLFGSQKSNRLVNERTDKLRSYYSPEEELRCSVAFQKWDTNPIESYMDSVLSFKLVKSVALDFLFITAGEAASERIFSIAYRDIKNDQTCLSPSLLISTTFIKNNKRAMPTA